MIAFLMVLAVLGVVFGVAVVLTGRAEGMSEEGQDFADTGIPRDRAMTPQDVIGLRFALAFRGYRMAEVDDALDRLAAELDARDEVIAHLRGERAGEEAYVPSEATGDAPVAALADLSTSSAWSSPAADAEPAYIPSDATGDLPDGVESEVTPAPDAEEPLPDTPAFVAPAADDYADGAGTVAGAGAAGGLGVGEAPALPEFAEPEPATPTTEPEPAAPEPAAAAADPAPAPARGDSPIFGALASGSLRPEVPEIPTYDPWSVTPRSRYTDGPTYVEVEHDDTDDPTEAIAEHQTGYAPAPAPTEAPNDAPADAPADASADDAAGDQPGEAEPPRAWPS